MFKVPNEYRNRTHPQLGSTDLEGNNGFFRMTIKGLKVNCIASNGDGFEHVSVTLDLKRTPSWEVMSTVKDIFWDTEDLVVQIHPPKSQYVDCHPYCLHLWRNDQIQAIMLPDKKMI